jgi:hypothetical protein
MYDYFQSLDQTIEKILVGLDAIGKLSFSLPNIPFSELNSGYDATMLTLISTINKLEKDIREGEGAIQNLPEEGVVGMLEVTGTPRIEARVEVRHDVLCLKSCLKGAEGMVEGWKELVNSWVEQRAVADRDDAAPLNGVTRTELLVVLLCCHILNEEIQ